MRKVTFMGCILALLLVGLVFLFSWLATCGIVYLIALCFSFEFTWPLATGIWLILFLLGSVFGGSKK